MKVDYFLLIVGLVILLATVYVLVFEVKPNVDYCKSLGAQTNFQREYCYQVDTSTHTIKYYPFAERDKNGV